MLKINWFNNQRKWLTFPHLDNNHNNNNNSCNSIFLFWFSWNVLLSFSQLFVHSLGDRLVFEHYAYTMLWCVWLDCFSPSSIYDFLMIIISFSSDKTYSSSAVIVHLKTQHKFKLLILNMHTYTYIVTSTHHERLIVLLIRNYRRNITKLRTV